MPRYEHRVYRVKIQWDGADFALMAMIQKDDWKNVDHLGEKGWQFIEFVPNHEFMIKDSFKESELPFIRLAVFRRELEEGENMWTSSKAK